MTVELKDAIAIGALIVSIVGSYWKLRAMIIQRPTAEKVEKMIATNTISAVKGAKLEAKIVTTERMLGEIKGILENLQTTVNALSEKVIRLIEHEELRRGQ